MKGTAQVLNNVTGNAPFRQVEVSVSVAWLQARSLLRAGSCRDQLGNRWQVIGPERLAARASVQLHLRGQTTASSYSGPGVLDLIRRGLPLTLTAEEHGAAVSRAG